MDAQRLSYPACVLAGQKIIDSQDILFLRKYAFPEGLTCAGDAVALLEIHRSAGTKCNDWDAGFVDLMADFIVSYCWPQGSLDEINANWIMEAFSSNGVVQSQAELDLLIHVIEISYSVPGFLSAFAIDQVRLALQGGTGAYANQRQSKRHGIAIEDIDYIRRILMGAHKGGRLNLSAGEDLVLKAINVLVSDRLNHPGWQDLLAETRHKRALKNVVCQSPCFELYLTGKNRSR